MPFEVRCPDPGCGRRHRVPSASAGQPVACRACGQTFVASDSATLKTPRSDGGSQPAPSRVASSATVPMAGAPQAIGRFVIRAKLGAGAFGTVYRAYDPQLDREVALKVPNPGTLSDARRVERFLREAKAAANLRHPHIVPVFDAGRDGDTLYIATAFIDGKPLSDDISEGGTDFARAARLARELAEALAYAHEQGVVHRDVKPHNVMLDKQDRVHLMDFGLAARADEEAKLTRDGAVLGTPAYMSPEQASGQKGEPQPATDQYAVGVVLYELLTGEVPFTGPLPVLLHNAVHADPDPPRARRKDVPKDLETICLKALAKRPESRYAGCQALADDLRRWLEREPITARRLTLSQRTVRWVRREPKLAAALVAVLALTAAVAVLASTRSVLLVRELETVIQEREVFRERVVLRDREPGEAGTPAAAPPPPAIPADPPKDAPDEPAARRAAEREKANRSARWEPFFDPSDFAADRTGGWEPDSRMTLSAGVVTARGGINYAHGWVTPPFAIRAQVHKVSGQNLAFGAGGYETGEYAFWFNGSEANGLGFFGLEQPRKAHFGTVRVPLPVPNRCEMALVVERRAVRCYVDRRLVLEAATPDTSSVQPKMGVHKGHAAFTSAQIIRLEGTDLSPAEVLRR